VIALLLISSAVMIGLVPTTAPLALALVMFSTAWPWHRAWRCARGTALRPALVWLALAIVVATVAQGIAWNEPVAGGRPRAGGLTYLAILATLAALVSVLNARAPGERIWASLMVLLVVLFFIPWLEIPSRLHRAHGLAQLRLDSPWTLFYGFLVMLTVSNYLPTRFGPAACWLALGFFLEYLGLTRVEWPAQRRASLWSMAAWSLAASLWTAHNCAGRARLAGVRLERLWFWFRDLWGVVWALRIQARFNRMAELKAWPMRLGWFGLRPLGGSSTDQLLPLPLEMEAAFRGMLWRFAHDSRLDEVLDPRVASSHDQADAARP
jgi:hypothetical protein